eukprot:1117291-Prymnesium_polylepis.1
MSAASHCRAAVRLFAADRHPELGRLNTLALVRGRRLRARDRLATRSSSAVAVRVHALILGKGRR